MALALITAMTIYVSVATALGLLTEAMILFVIFVGYMYFQYGDSEDGRYY